jgi:hypothetical protein
MKGRSRFPAAVTEISSPVFYTYNALVQEFLQPTGQHTTR